jgi:hypothetical protein
LDSRQVSQGQKETVQIDARGLGHPLSAFAPAPLVQKWLWLRVGTIDPSLGFRATEHDISCYHRRAKILRPRIDPAFGILSLELMDRN